MTVGWRPSHCDCDQGVQTDVCAGVDPPEFQSDLWLVSSAILLNPNVTQDVAEEIQNREDVIIIIFL